jgi:putative FmdB family regulatory protein
MPIYEYHCEKCNKTTEISHGMSEKRFPKCPKCGKKMERIISRNSFQLKGSGWYKTDYAKKPAAGKKETPSSSES